MPEFRDFKNLNGMTIYMGCVAAVITGLAVLGFVLAFTVAPDAINMGLGCAIGAPFAWAVFAAMRHIDLM